MPLKSPVKQSAVQHLRRPRSPDLWAWLRAWLWACVVAWACVAAHATPQDFPEAAEDNHFIFGPDGTYSFSYDTGSGEHQSFRTEARDSEGRVTGRFGYVDPDGVLRITEYQADSGGYRANMEIYHLVSMSPRTPLLVGPLPQPVSQPQSLPDLKEAPRHTTSGPVEPSPFIPPQRPVLIIGPLPKPLQPPRSLLDQSPPDLSEDTLLGASPESLSLLPPPDFLRGPRINDSLRISSPEVLHEEILDVIIQHAREDVHEDSETELPNTSFLNATFELNNNNTFESTDLQIESPQSTLDHSYKNLLQESEQTGIEMTAFDTVKNADDSTSTSPNVPLGSIEDTISISVANNAENNSTQTNLSVYVSNATFDTSVEINPEQPRKHKTEIRQNNFQTSFFNETSETVSQMPPVTVETNTVTISQSKIASVSSQGLGTSLPDQGGISSLEYNTSLVDHRRASSPELGTTVTDHGSASSPELGTTVTDHRSASSPELGTTMVDHKNASSLEPGNTEVDHGSAFSPDLGKTVADHRNGADQPSTLTNRRPAVPAITYLPVSGYSYDIPTDVYSELPLAFTPFA